MATSKHHKQDQGIDMDTGKEEEDVGKNSFERKAFGKRRTKRSTKFHSGRNEGNADSDDADEQSPYRPEGKSRSTNSGRVNIRGSTRQRLSQAGKKGASVPWSRSTNEKNEGGHSRKGRDRITQSAQGDDRELEEYRGGTRSRRGSNLKRKSRDGDRDDESSRSRKRQKKSQTHRILETWKEHDKVRGLIQQILLESDQDKKQRLFNLLVKELATHEVAEEVVIHPAYQKIAGKNKTYQKALEQETDFSEILYQLDQEYSKNMNRSLNPKLKAAEKDLLKHMHLEERNIFTTLESELSLEELEDLNKRFERVKSFAPTRPHPMGPRTAIGNIAAAPLVSIYDRLRDFGKDFPDGDLDSMSE